MTFIGSVLSSCCFNICSDTSTQALAKTPPVDEHTSLIVEQPLRSNKSDETIQVSQVINTIAKDKWVITSKKFRVEVDTTPSEVCQECIYIKPSESVRQKQLRPFSAWSKAELTSTATTISDLCKQGAISTLSIEHCSKLIEFIAQNQNELCQATSVIYTGRFVIPPESTGPSDSPRQLLRNTERYVRFELEVHSSTKINLLFLGTKAHKISDGTSKEWYKGFSLADSKIVAIGMHKKPNKYPAETSKKLCDNEISYIKRVNEYPHIGQVNRISSYTTTLIIEMEYYPRTLFEIIESIQVGKDEPPIKDSDKIKHCIQLVEAVTTLSEKEGIVHRDIKVENLMEDSSKNLRLIDFEFACQFNDTEALKDNYNSPLYAAPEVIFLKVADRGTGIDVWGMGCCIWLYLTTYVYPWHQDVMDINTKAKMQEFDRKEPPKICKLLFLFWNLFRFEAKDRWSARQALTYLKELEKDVPPDSTTYFRDMFLKEARLMNFLKI